MARAAPKGSGLLKDDRGLAAVEFALILPALLAIMLFGFQLTVYVNATRKVALVAQSISQMISRAVPPSNSTTALVNATDLHFSYDAAMVLFPYVLVDAKRQGIAWWQNITINYSSIAFTKIASNCTDTVDLSACYTANVVWTSTGVASTDYRPCGTPQSPADNQNTPSRTTLPRSVFGPASLIVIDVTFTFKPTFGSALLPTIKIARSAYLQPRYANLINYDLAGSDGIASRCPGY